MIFKFCKTKVKKLFINYQILNHRIKNNYSLEDDDLKTIFDEQDTDADGELSKEEFGNAVFSVLKANKSEEAGEEEEEDDQ